MSDEGIRDRELLDQYAQKGLQEAFAQIVQRYVNLVYNTCFRDLRDHHLAEDATQAVFLVLAQKARSLRREVVLAGWLFQTARLVVRNVRKQEARRKARERLAAEMTQQTSTRERKWDACTPLLSEGLEKLSTKDRDAILLHYYQRKTLAEVGGATGVSEDAARMRVSRAMQKLRSFFARKGQTMAIGAVATLLMTSAVQAAPPNYAAGIVASVCPAAGTVALASGTAAALAKATLNAFFMAKLKIAAAVAAVTLLVPTAGLATYQVIAKRQEADRQAFADSIIVEGVGPAPAVPSAAGSTAPQPVPSRPMPSAAARNPAPPKAQSPSPQPATKPDVPPADLLRFKVENGLLVVSGPAIPADGKPVRIALRGLPGETTISRKPTGLFVENSRISDKGEIRTRLTYQLGTSLEIQRTIKLRSGKEYAVLLRQSHASDPASKVAVQTTLQVTADGGENWNSWAADDFPRFVENYPLAFFAHLAPVLRDFSAWNLCTVPAAVAHKVLNEAKTVAPRGSLADMLSHPEKNSAAIVWRREIEMLSRDAGFLIDCMESDELDIRTAAVKQLSEVTGKPVAFDVNAPPQKRKAALNLLRRRAAREERALEFHGHCMASREHLFQS